MKHVFLIFLLLLTTGCATLQAPIFNVEVDSLARQSSDSAKSYVLLPGDENIGPNDLLFQEYAIQLARVLTAKGFALAESAETADLAIFLSYGIGDPENRQFSYSMPVWGQTGIASSNTFGTASFYGNNANYSGTTTYTPTYGITGYASHTGTITTYHRFTQVRAYDLKRYRKTDQEIEEWRTTISSVGRSGDLRRVFPIMLAAAVPYIATNTGRKISVELKEQDPIVRAVKGEDVVGK